MPKISIIIPAYNNRQYLQECLDSIIGQDFRDIEIILVNDGSTDGSLEIMQRYAQRDARISIFNKPNAGVSAARNSGLEHARGTYIMFVDADDYLLDAGAVGRIYEATKQNDTTVIYDIAYENKAAAYPFPTGTYGLGDAAGFTAFMIKNEHLNSPCNKLYLRRVIKEHGIRFNKDIKIGEDLLFNIQYFAHCRAVYYLNARLYFYRTSNNSSATKQFSATKYGDLMYVNRRLSDYAASTKHVTVVGAANFIRIKNVLSCLRDMGRTDTGLPIFKKWQLARRYKKENAWIIVTGNGLGLWALSVAYSIVPASMSAIAASVLFRRKV